MPNMKDPFRSLPPFDPETDCLNVIIETPKGSRNKYKYDEQRGLFTLHKMLPAGNTFPYDFGYIPSTRGEDGDPLDVLVLMDEHAFPGCYIPARLIGVIRAEQTESGKTVQNDRLIAIATSSQEQRDISSLGQLNPYIVEEIEHFFVSYHEMEDKPFYPEARFGPTKARKIVKAAIVELPTRPKKTARKSKK